jgi:hypothetical protein
MISVSTRTSTTSNTRTPRRCGGWPRSGATTSGGPPRAPARVGSGGFPAAGSGQRARRHEVTAPGLRRLRGSGRAGAGRHISRRAEAAFGHGCSPGVDGLRQTSTSDGGLLSGQRPNRSLRRSAAVAAWCTNSRNRTGHTLAEDPGSERTHPEPTPRSGESWRPGQPRTSPARSPGRGVPQRRPRSGGEDAGEGRGGEPERPCPPGPHPVATPDRGDRVVGDPQGRAGSRVDQCVIPYFFGGAVNVAVFTSRRLIWRGRPVRRPRPTNQLFPVALPQHLRCGGMVRHPPIPPPIEPANNYQRGAPVRPHPERSQDPFAAGDRYFSTDGTSGWITAPRQE